MFVCASCLGMADGGLVFPMLYASGFAFSSVVVMAKHRPGLNTVPVSVGWCPRWLVHSIEEMVKPNSVKNINDKNPAQKFTFKNFNGH